MKKCTWNKFPIETAIAPVNVAGDDPAAKRVALAARWKAAGGISTQLLGKLASICESYEKVLDLMDDESLTGLDQTNVAYQVQTSWQEEAKGEISELETHIKGALTANVGLNWVLSSIEFGDVKTIQNALCEVILRHSIWFCAFQNGQEKNLEQVKAILKEAAPKIFAVLGIGPGVAQVYFGLGVDEVANLQHVTILSQEAYDTIVSITSHFKDNGWALTPQIQKQYLWQTEQSIERQAEFISSLSTQLDEMRASYKKAEILAKNLEPAQPVDVPSVEALMTIKAGIASALTEFADCVKVLKANKETAAGTETGEKEPLLANIEVTPQGQGVLSMEGTDFVGAYLFSEYEGAIQAKLAANQVSARIKPGLILRT